MRRRPDAMSMNLVLCGLLVSACGAGGVLVVSEEPYGATTVRAGVSVGYHDELAAYGSWVSDPTYGDVFVPSDRGFEPYTRGYWVDSPDGLVWESSEPYGRVTEHYGRWAYDDGRGWRWKPGHEYG